MNVPEEDNNSIDLEVMRHSFAHVLAMAIQRLFPSSKLGIGPATKYGFYYEVELPQNSNKPELADIENEMRNIIAEEIPFKQLIVDKEQAFNTLIQLGQIYKSELLQTIPDQQVSFYRTGEEFIDLCRGPHVKHTGELGIFKLISISTVHWLGDTSRPKLLKIEGVGFANNQQLLDYEVFLEERKNRNHLKLGPALDLFVRKQTNAYTNLYWKPKGAILINNIISYSTKLLNSYSYQEVDLPLFNNIDNQISMRSELVDYDDIIYKAKRISYKELPLKYFAKGKVFQKNDTDSFGLFNLNEYTSIEAFSYSPNHKLSNLISESIHLNQDILNMLSIDDYRVNLCIPDLSNINLQDKEKKVLNNHFQILKTCLNEAEVTFKITTSAKFIHNSPYITFVTKDINDREWILSRIAINYYPDIKQVVFSNSRDSKEKAYIVRNQLIFSIERIVAQIIETQNGELPVWMAPIQTSILSISEKYNEYVTQIEKELLAENIRVIINIKNDTIHNKIRKAQILRIPYMLIIGEKEIKTNSVSLRNREGQELGLIRIDEFIDKIKSEIEIEKKLTF